MWQNPLLHPIFHPLLLGEGENNQINSLSFKERVGVR